MANHAPTRSCCRILVTVGVRRLVAAGIPDSVRAPAAAPLLSSTADDPSPQHLEQGVASRNRSGELIDNTTHPANRRGLEASNQNSPFIAVPSYLRRRRALRLRPKPAPLSDSCRCSHCLADTAISEPVPSQDARKQISAKTAHTLRFLDTVLRLSEHEANIFYEPSCGYGSAGTDRRTGKRGSRGGADRGRGRPGYFKIEDETATASAVARRRPRAPRSTAATPTPACH